MSIKKQMDNAGMNAIIMFPKIYDNAAVSGGPKASPDGPSYLIDCGVTGLRVAAATVADRPDEFVIVVGKKNSDDFIKTDVLPLSDLTTATLIRYMETYFHK
ncbi:hypothetical protein SAMN05444507_112173 [Pseudomonas syringae]|uniref:hypothetical protein n=1 Tax=Pseudomonas syringae group TaxID=136849 RepID=UPI0007EE6490|nr:MULTISPECIES: hypothetical protein [Pseudomonas syringae group]OBS37823.1 hypothetical protein A9K79_20055 [Pseudomonas syringae pv. syringae]RML85449.1 hypothetical protein ALQ87_03502 [Pseudomonas savastanoi pv. glycinea]SFI91203.1 hypothetical protein SAMN05444507_112173 [Pseudomonas syringae]